MIAKDSSSTLSTPAAAGGGLLGVQPLASPISITINFILQPFALVLGSACVCARAEGPLPLTLLYPFTTTPNFLASAVVTLSELQPILTFLSSIVGFQGIVFSVVGVLFGLLAAKAETEAEKAPENATIYQEES